MDEFFTRYLKKTLKPFAIVEWDGDVGCLKVKLMRLIAQDPSASLSKYLNYTNSQTVEAGMESYCSTCRILTQRDIFQNLSVISQDNKIGESCSHKVMH